MLSKRVRLADQIDTYYNPDIDMWKIELTCEPVGSTMTYVTYITISGDDARAIARNMTKQEPKS